ncbi:LutB/LldF family L-lactate oxidation iron-sulfur protein [Thalassospiraceae bacterium LMO-JJ14]|nr:LutB/LldF family L-lactate oxidation iron-sulfur protein [Thalassospiraceae bacterium LMO-JJ14]
MQSTSPHFKENAKDALADDPLQAALAKLAVGFPVRRLEAAARLPEFEDLRDQARDIKTHVLENLDYYLQAYEKKVTESGGHVHWCRDAEEARNTILEICRKANAKTVTKSKSMISEEIAVNAFLEDNGIEPVETDLGEYIIQLRKEPPSHIIAPAIHLSKEQVAETFRNAHLDLAADRPLIEPRALLEEARAKLREKFLGADVGLTGANMLIAETGTNVLVTNEGNADLTNNLPRVHVVIASIEKIVPTLEDASTILRVLARSATGQDISVYTTFCTGPKRPEDLDGPEEYHVVLLDNGRSDMIGSEFHEMLRCIRCGACLNHCPIYKSVGGHAYGWVYSGPMGAVLIPNLIGMEEAQHLPNASTLCGKCESVCPMRIPLPKMLRKWRERQFKAEIGSSTARWALKSWAWLAKRPRLYRWTMSAGVAVLGQFGGRGRFKSLPLVSGWTSKRDLAAPCGDTFISQYHKGARGDQSGALMRKKVH